MASRQKANNKDLPEDFWVCKVCNNPQPLNELHTCRGEEISPKTGKPVRKPGWINEPRKD